MKKLTYIFWLLPAYGTARHSFGDHQHSQYVPGLRFGADGQFRITVFSDLHFGEESWKDCAECQSYDARTTKAMNDILDWEPTNLAVFNGDLLSAEAVMRENYTEYIDRIVRPLVDRNIPWASTYGNHDRHENTVPADMLRKEQSYNTKERALSWTQNLVPGDDERVGTSNYFVPVYTSTSKDVAMVLWFFDSRAGGAAGKKNAMLEDYVAPEVVNWYIAQQASFTKTFGSPIPSLAFVHIPFKPSLDLQRLRRKNPAIAPGIDDEIIGHQANTCANPNDAEDCTYNGLDAPFANALVNTDGLIAVFSGHDHKIDWCMKWSPQQYIAGIPQGKGLNVCFGRRTGYGGYGKTHAKGVRKITVSETDLRKGEIETWVRLESGRVSGHVRLNATYGVDRYPPAVGAVGKADAS